MNPQQHNEAADIETASEGYAQRFAGPVGEWMLDCQAGIVRDLLADHSGVEVLDVGGGHAQLARPLANAGFAVTVHGSAPECANRIDDLVENGSCKFVCSSMFELPAADASVDTVLCFRLLTHCDEWPRLAAELCRVAERSIIIDYPTSQSLNAISSGLFGFKKKLEGNTRTWTLFRHAEIAAPFEQHGFRCTKLRKQFFLPMVLHRVLRCPPLSRFLEAICRGLGLTRLWGSPVIAEFTR